jgi:phosphoribosylformylglycinamidine (FGAM) synthase-like amidotransferase family enzyme
MRSRMATKTEILEGNQTVYFQIAHGNGRQACSVKTKFSTQQQASRYLRQNWNKIEQMARDCLANGSLEDGRINLVMI